MSNTVPYRLLYTAGTGYFTPPYTGVSARHAADGTRRAGMCSALTSEALLAALGRDLAQIARSGPGRLGIEAGNVDTCSTTCTRG